MRFWARKLGMLCFSNPGRLWIRKLRRIKLNSIMRKKTYTMKIDYL